MEVKGVYLPAEIWLMIFDNIPEYKPVLNLVCTFFKNIMELSRATKAEQLLSIVLKNDRYLFYYYLHNLKYPIHFFVWKAVTTNNERFFAFLLGMCKCSFEQNTFFEKGDGSEEWWEREKKKKHHLIVDILFDHLFNKRQFDCLKILCTEGNIILNQDVFKNAIKDNDLVLIQFCRDIGRISLLACDIAARHSNLATMKLLTSLGFIYDEETLRIAQTYQNINVIPFLTDLLL